MTTLTRGSWLLVGCGYLGTHVLARLSAARATVAVVTRDAARAAGFERDYGARGVVGAYADDALLERCCTTLPAPLRVLCLLPPSACADAANRLAPYTQFCAALDRLRPARAVLSSSTGVYGEQGGARVTAETPCRPVSARERRLHEIEGRWLSGGERHVLRCAGLYGPDRIVGLAGLVAGQAVPGDPDGWLNLLHVDDAATLLLRMALDAPAAIELGADGRPVTRRVYYATLAAWAGVRQPRFDGTHPARGGGARRCDPGTTCARLDWRPMFADFKAGLAACEYQG